MNDEAFVSILTVNWNGRRTVQEWLKHIAAIEYPRQRLEIVIHDNASTDGSQEILREALAAMRGDGWRRLVLIEATEHPGLRGAYNNAFAATSPDSEYLLQIDNDVRLDPSALRRLVDIMR